MLRQPKAMLFNVQVQVALEQVVALVQLQRRRGPPVRIAFGAEQGDVGAQKKCSCEKSADVQDARYIYKKYSTKNIDQKY